MSKKIAMVLILFMVANCIAWADDDNTIWIIIGVGSAVLFGIGLFAILVSYNIVEAEPEEGSNNIKLVSMSFSQPQIKTGFGPVLNVLQHIDMGVTPDNRTYLGLRFQF